MRASGLKRILKSSDVLVRFYRNADLAFRSGLCTLSPEWLAKFSYRKQWGRWPDLRQPQTFDEKLLWLMLYWRHPLKTCCSDKYAVRAYVKEHGLEPLLLELLGVYDSSSQIDFDRLPERFVLKCTHGSGWNIICASGTVDRDDVRRRLTEWLGRDYSKVGGEVHYASIKPRIVAEQFLDDGTGALPIDYKVYCFAGRAHCTMTCTGRGSGQVACDFYDRAWREKLPYSKSSLAASRWIPEPAGYREMLAAAELLSKPFPFVRVDFYSVAGRAYIGEMTFTPHGCIDTGYTDVAQRELGRLVELPRPYVE